MAPTETQTLGEPKLWEAARKYAEPLNPPSALFATTVRTLLAESRSTEPAPQGISREARFLLNRLVRSPSMMARLYYAGLTCREEGLAALPTVRPEDLIGLFTTRQLAVMLTIIYLHSRLRAKSSPEQWVHIEDNLQRYLDLGMALGDAIPAIGFDVAMHTAAAKWLTWAAFVLHEAEPFKKYRISLKMRRLPFDLAWEVKSWGTSHPYIYAILLQCMGFGVKYAEAYFESMQPKKSSALSEKALRFRVAREWIEGLMIEGKPPEGGLGDDYLLTDDREDLFVKQFEAIETDGSRYAWLTKSHQDLGPEKTPKIPAKYCVVPKRPKRPSRAKSQQDGIEYEDLPDSIREQFPEQELLELIDEIQDLLD